MSANRDSSARFLENSIHLFGFVVLAVAQPILDLLGRQTEFFVVRRSGPAEIALLVAGLAVFLPLLLVAVEFGIRTLSVRAYEVVHSALIAALGSILGMQVLKRLLPLSGPVVILVSVLLGLACAVVLSRIAWARVLCRYIGFLSLALVATFFLQPGVRALMLPPTVESPGTGGTSTATTPVVMVVFDAFPLTVLMDSEEGIDASLFPNFAALAEESIWFRNATTVSDNTLHAVPSILTGLLPKEGQQATATDHPNNLFSLLAGSHDMRVLETQTHLWQGDDDTMRNAPLGERIASLISDVTVVWLHLTLPEDLQRSLPSISQGWEGFTLESSVDDRGDNRPGDPGGAVSRFLEQIEATDLPVLHFMHVLLPHPPYSRYPSGTRYTRSKVEPSGEGDQWGEWSNDEWAVMQSYQRLLLQTGFIDSFIGDLVSRLRESGLYDASLLIITADHGSSFRPGSPHRPLSESNVGEIMPVPLIVKTPGQVDVGISDANAQSVDILPTVGEVLQIDVPWSPDGRSLLAVGKPAEPVKVCFKGAKGPVEFQVADLVRARREAVHWKHERFPSGPFEVVSRGYEGQLIGRRPGDLDVRESGSELRTTLDEVAALREVELDSGFVPGSVTGFLQPAPGPVELAVALNGTIQATTRTYLDDSLAQVGAWSALLPETTFVEGANALEVFLIEVDKAGRLILEPVDVEGGAPSILGINVGLARMGPIKRGGFHGSTQAPDGTPIAWTNGDARIVVPIDPAEKPEFVEVAVKKSSPEGANVEILVNDVRVFDGEIEPGPWRTRLSLEGVPIHGKVVISLRSSTFVRRGLRRDRPYGLALEGVWLR